MVFDVYNPHDNTNVTDFYLEIIASSLRQCGIETNYINHMSEGEKKSNKGVLVADVKDVLQAKQNNYKYIIYWIQGVAPEEFWLKKHDILRYCLYSYREYRALRQSDVVFFCSDEMKAHYERKYRFKVDNSFVMPCFNEEIKFDVIQNKAFEENIFIYAGSLEKWQNFENTVRYYKLIEEKVPDAKFNVFVKDIDEAKKILNKYSVKNYDIAYVGKDALTNEIRRAKFGFCLREDVTVNRVATPTKLSNYISNGVMPVYSECLSSFHGQAKSSSFCFNVNEQNCIDRIVSICNSDINSSDVLSDFTDNFGLYYSRSYYENQIKNIIQKLK